jgi:hypothetical protein
MSTVKYDSRSPASRRLMPWLVFAVALFAFQGGGHIPSARSLISPPGSQEPRDSDRQSLPGPARKKSVAEATERLRLTVNNDALVRTQCLSQGQTVEVEEGTRVTDVDGCKFTFKTVKTTISHGDRQRLEFILYTDLADLTTPPSVQPQTFSHCKPVSGAVVKVMSRADVGKTVRATRLSEPEPSKGNSTSGRIETETLRRDLSLFFPSAAAAAKAGRALGDAIQACGGKEWPDDDDLP